MTVSSPGPTSDKLDAYFDAAPRPDAEAVDAGAFTLFVSRTPWSYYARPAIGHRQAITADDLAVLERTCAEHGVDLAIEWVHEVHPELADVASAYGLELSSHALMVLDTAGVKAPAMQDVAVRVLEADDPALLTGRAVADVSFTAGGTAVLPGGAKERDAFAEQLPAELVDHLQDRSRRGLTVTAVAIDADGVLAVGSCQPVGEAAEVLAVATLPEHRRRGLAAAVTSTLVAHGAERGVRTALLSAQDDDVARVYERVGFRRVGTMHAAERAD